MLLKSITNFLQVSDEIASSGQPFEEDFRFIASAGYKSVINLAMPDSDNAIPEEGYIVTRLGMSYHHIPVPFEVPETSHLIQFFGLMEALQSKKVWVHCALNYRASAFLYLYLQWKGMSEPEAQSALLKDWEPDAIWHTFMKQPIDEISLHDTQ